MVYIYWPCCIYIFLFFADEFPPNESVGFNDVNLSSRLICMVTDWEDHMGRGVGQDEDELLEDLCCPIHRKPCEARKEDNYFFALSKYQQPLEELLSSNPDFVRPSFRMNEVCVVTEHLRVSVDL
jgi:hypothetical protein